MCRGFRLDLNMTVYDIPPEPAACTVYEIVESFRWSLLPSRPTPTHARAAKQTSRVASIFIHYMSGVAEPPVHLLYLASQPRFAEWLGKLRRSLAPTTVAGYLHNSLLFIIFLKRMRPTGMELTQYQLKSIKLRLKMDKRHMREELADHRRGHLEAKTARLLSAAEMRQYLAAAKLKIPASLQVMEEDPKWSLQVNRCIGLLVGYLTCLSGVRKGCFLYMSNVDVLGAVLAGGDDDGARVLTLGRHKTQRVNGTATMLLTQEEHGWLLAYGRLRPLMAGYSPGVNTFFFNTTGQPMERMTRHVTAAFSTLTHREGVTLTGIRTAVATLSARRLTVDQQTELGRAMGHSLPTRDRWYVVLGNGLELRANRAMLEEAMAPPAEAQDHRITPMPTRRTTAARPAEAQDHRITPMPTTTARPAEAQDTFHRTTAEDTSEDTSAPPPTKRRKRRTYRGPLRRSKRNKSR